MSGKGGAGNGNVYLLTVARLGSGAFDIQMGTSVSSTRTLKVDARAAMAKDVNPEVDVENFSLGCVSQQGRVHIRPGRNIRPLQRITLMIQTRQIARLRPKA